MKLRFLLNDPEGVLLAVGGVGSAGRGGVADAILGGGVTGIGRGRVAVGGGSAGRGVADAMRGGGVAGTGRGGVAAGGDVGRDGGVGRARAIELWCDE